MVYHMWTVLVVIGAVSARAEYQYHYQQPYLPVYYNYQHQARTPLNRYFTQGIGNQQIKYETRSNLAPSQSGNFNYNQVIYQRPSFLSPNNFYNSYSNSKIIQNVPTSSNSVPQNVQIDSNIVPHNVQINSNSVIPQNIQISSNSVPQNVQINSNSAIPQNVQINSNSIDPTSNIKPQTKIMKHIYFHVAPPDVEPSSPVKAVPTPVKKKATYNLVFIKLPQQSKYNKNSQGFAINPYAPVEDKTVIYVLVKKPEDEGKVIAKAPNHEVYYVKYKDSSNSAPAHVNKQLSAAAVPSLRPGLVNGLE